MATGGKREGSGRPKGATTRPQLRDSYTPKELKDFITNLKEKAKTDLATMRFVAEQIFGKAPQPISNDGDKPLIVQFDNAFIPSSKESSEE